jgi:acetyl esterase/lipase
MYEIVAAPQELIDESEAVNTMVADLLAAAPSTHPLPPEVTRQARREGTGWSGAIVHSDGAVDRSVPGPGGDLTLRTIVGDQVHGVYLHIHGGGWTLGAADQQDVLLQRFADEAHVAVVSVDYRLAPEHPYPAGPDDCAAAAAWVIQNAPTEWGTDRIVIGGESAGAHLSAVTLLRLRDELGAPDAVVAANLVFGAYDMSLTPSSRNWGDTNMVLSTPIMEWFGDQFMPGISAEDRRRPDLSPLYADLAGLPPALFTVGTRDPLLDDSLFMSMRWSAAGNDTTLSVYPESIHGFTALPTGMARLSITEQIEFISGHLRA